MFVYRLYMYLLLGQRIGPEPTTDRFTAVMDGPDERIIPGNALAVSHDLPCKQTSYHIIPITAIHPFLSFFSYTSPFYILNHLYSFS